eukprot:COSAG02_NODE_5_length_66751_cov_63.939148_13_plen_122_part_00
MSQFRESSLTLWHCGLGASSASGMRSVFTIPYRQISRLFLLPRPDHTKVSFIISVEDPPIFGIRHFIAELPAEHEAQLTLNLSAAELAVANFGCRSSATLRYVHLQQPTAVWISSKLRRRM